jgi:hypothetical protein
MGHQYGALLAREDYVEEVWRIVDSVLKKDTPVYTYEPKTWGPREVRPGCAGRRLAQSASVSSARLLSSHIAATV